MPTGITNESVESARSDAGGALWGLQKASVSDAMHALSRAELARLGAGQP